MHSKPSIIFSRDQDFQTRNLIIILSTKHNNKKSFAIHPSPMRSKGPQVLLSTDTMTACWAAFMRVRNVSLIIHMFMRANRV